LSHRLYWKSYNHFQSERKSYFFRCDRLRTHLSNFKFFLWMIILYKVLHMYKYYLFFFPFFYSKWRYHMFFFKTIIISSLFSLFLFFIVFENIDDLFKSWYFHFSLFRFFSKWPESAFFRKSIVFSLQSIFFTFLNFFE